MGGFYGSVQLRTEDRARVTAAADAAAKAAGARCLIGPVLNGWVGVYPEDAGQDQNLAAAIAKEVGGDVLHAVVHDDDVMAYWFWHDGELDDAYWSSPGYFNEADRAAQEQLSGDPVAFGPLVEKRAAEMMKILRRDHPEITFEAARLQQFADLLGIRNAVTSYEYLKGGERIGIERWEDFIEVPSEAVAAERAARRERRRAIAAEKEQLARAGLLLADAAEDRLLAAACAAGGGMLLSWEGFGRGESRTDFYRAPWTDAEPGEIETGGQVNSIVADASGHRVAMALGNRVVVWDVEGWNPILELVESDWAIKAALSADGRLLAYASREGVFVHDIDTGQRLTALATHDGAALAFHPGGEWLLSAGSAVWLARIGATDPWRELYPGGQTPTSSELSQAVAKEMTRVDLDRMEKKWRDALEVAIQKLAATGGDPRTTAQLVAKMRQQMDKQLQQMHANFANLRAGKLPPPRHGNETVMCAGFTRDGDRLWLGTDRGLRVYDWPAVVAAADKTAMPAPTHAHDPKPANATAGSPGMIYAAAEVPGGISLLFGGYAGSLCQLNLFTGAVRELAAPPDGGAIVGITPAPDASAVGVCSRPALGAANDKLDERAIWQIWSYPTLLAQPPAAPAAPPIAPAV